MLCTCCPCHCQVHCWSVTSFHLSEFHQEGIMHARVIHTRPAILPPSLVCRDICTKLDVPGLN